MTSKEIYHMLQSGERVTLECKRAKSAVPNSIWETYSAFANTYGGTILMGVEENLQEKNPAKRFTITGVEDAVKIRKDLWNMLNNPEKVNVNLLKDSDIDTVSVDGKDVVYIHVPAASYLLRPIYINNNPIRGTYRRHHEGDYHASQEMIRMMLRDSNNSGNDHLFLEYYTMDDVDIRSLEQYRLLFRTDHPEHVWNRLEHKEFLLEFGGYTINRQDGKEGLTMAGLLMFGKGRSIRERFGNLRMDYIDKSHLLGDQRYSDRLTYDGTWENNLFNFLQTTLPRLTKDLPRPFQMDGMLRKDDTPLHKAIREACTNAIIHADLMQEGLIRFVKYEDRFEITNPGLLKLPVELIYAGNESKARNQSIQGMLRMIGYGENMGSGFPLILNAWKEKHWIIPELIEQPDLMQVKLILRLGQEHLVNVTENVTNERSKNQEDKYNEGDIYVTNAKNDVPNDFIMSLSDRQKSIIRILIGQSTITVDQLALEKGVNRRTILRDLKVLQEHGLISREGQRNNGRWIIHYSFD